jgi:hypothetical protein
LIFAIQNSQNNFEENIYSDFIDNLVNLPEWFYKTIIDKHSFFNNDYDASNNSSNSNNRIEMNSNIDNDKSKQFSLGEIIEEKSYDDYKDNNNDSSYPIKSDLVDKFSYIKSNKNYLKI